MYQSKFVTTVIAMCAASLAVSFDAAGQYAIGDGTALDNNLQLGSGGRNPAAQQVDYRLRNAVITGNVTGLGYFHDDVGYRSSSDFAGSLGSDDLFRFRATSLSPSQVAGDYSLRSVTEGYSGAYVPRSFASQTPAAISHNNRLLLPNAGGADDRPDAQRVRSARGLSERLSVGRDDSGRIIETTTSPLLGVRQRELAPRPPINIDGVEPDSDVPTKQQGIDAAAPRARVAAPTLAIASVLDGRVDAGRPIDAATFDETVKRIEARLFSPLGSRSAKPGEDVYLDMLTRIKQQRDRLAGKEPDEPHPNTLIAKPSGDDEPGTASTARRGLAELDLSEPDDAELAAAEARRREALRNALGLPDKAAAEDEAVADDADDVDESTLTDEQKTLLEARRRIQRLMAALDHDMPVMRSAAGAADSRENQMVREAEQLLADGRYFDAESKYRDVLRLSPDRPLVEVGRVHAQLGAGMIRSAAANLRRLIVDHPELIATRYSRNLLPSRDRARFLDGQLRKMIATGKRPDAAIMLAYLGYQAGSQRIVRYGLAQAQAMSPQDPLLPLLRKVWVDREPPTQTPRPDSAEDESSSGPTDADNTLKGRDES